MQRGSGEVRDLGETAGRAVCDFGRTGDEHFALMAAPATTGDRIILGAQGDFRLVDLGETGERPGATMARRSLAPRSHADL